MKFAVHYLEPEQECAVMVCMALLLSAKELEIVWPEAVTKAPDPEDVEVVVVPLQRIGAPAGKSGAEVFVVYLRSVKQSRGSLPPSKALVMKLERGANKLADEMAAAERWPQVAPDRFAKPIKLYSLRGYTVLVAPFRAEVDHLPEEHLLKFQSLLDLYRTIVESEKVGTGSAEERLAMMEKVATGVGSALDLVAQAHNHPVVGAVTGPQCLPMRYSKEYDWYLRNTNKPNEAAKARVGMLFGNLERVTAFGESWTNPVRLVETLVGSRDHFDGMSGAVHGDLHPKNILFGKSSNVQIIDFGWARNEMHVTVDYVLLDINLRAMTLPSQVMEQDLVSAAKCLFPSDPFPSHDCIMSRRLQIIRDQIWSRAIATHAVTSKARERWVSEYLVPYFLVAYGLLVFLDDARNQRAMLACVLAASDRINRELPPAK